ncbi:MAG: NTP transferase domain-containing protein [Spirochaetales bacterium]|nr:NTP transferase domain-containing protein [Spirochaetales bacterium]
MDAIVLAAGKPGPSAPLYALTRGDPKALLKVGGQTMLERVVSALADAPSIQRIYIVGLEYSSRSGRPITCLADQGGLFSNGMYALKRAAADQPSAGQFLITSSDIPALRAEMVEWLIGQARGYDDDIFYNVISKEIMERRYPGSGRTYVRLKGQEVCGGDLIVVSARMIKEKEDLWRGLFAARKNPFRLAALIGIRTLILFLFRQLTLDAAVAAVSSRLGIRGRVLLCPFAEMGMDIDKPDQLKILDRDLSPR